MQPPIAFTEGLYKKIGNTAVIREVDLTISEGQTAVVLGESESGKSVLLKLLAGLLPPTSGRIEIAGNAPDSPEAHAAIAYHAAPPSLPGYLTVPELVRLYATLFSDFDAEKAMALLSELKVKTDKQIRKFSKSTRVKISLILTVCRRVRLYLMDDPITGDDATRAYLLRILLENRQKDASLVIATRDASLLREHADGIYVLTEGKLKREGGEPHTTPDGGEPT